MSPSWAFLLRFVVSASLVSAPCLVGSDPTHVQHVFPALRHGSPQSHFIDKMNPITGRQKRTFSLVPQLGLWWDGGGVGEAVWC